MIDWQRLALDIRSHQSLQSASKGLGMNKGYLAQLARGEVREPKFSDGLQLLDLHFDLCGGEKTRGLRA